MSLNIDDIRRAISSEGDVSARLIKSKDSEILTESEVDKLIAEIVSRTRTHPDIARGASVRGTLAFKEVLRGLAEIGNGLSRDSIRKAALITLPPRILSRQRGNEITIVSDIVQEVLYDMRFSGVKDESVSPVVLDWLSTNDIAEGLKKLSPLISGQSQKLTQEELPNIITEAAKNQEMFNYLQPQKLLKKGRGNRYSFTRKQSRILTRELADTIMELMDAQDRQWNGEMSFEQMHLYYHIKANSGRDELSPHKRDYDGLKTLIDDLEKQGILRASETAGGFALTGEALETLLEHLTVRLPGGRGLPGAIDFSRTLISERQQEIRRYRSGDFFGDISVRHTLKEIVRQQKDLPSVRRSDFRVFMKQPRKRQSDIVLCLDTSASMGAKHKLIYARLAAAGLTRAAIENGDRVGVVTFNNFGQTTILFTDKNKDAIISHLVKLSARGNTNIGDGIKCASQLLFKERNHNQKYILLITDGQPTAVSARDFDRLKVWKEKDLTEESAILETRKAVAKGVKVSVIHIASKDEAGGQFISNIARDGRGKVRRISRLEDLEAIWRW